MNDVYIVTSLATDIHCEWNVKNANKDNERTILRHNRREKELSVNN